MVVCFQWPSKDIMKIKMCVCLVLFRLTVNSNRGFCPLEKVVIYHKRSDGNRGGSLVTEIFSDLFQTIEAGHLFFSR